jgi:hypothetical protein
LHSERAAVWNAGIDWWKHAGVVWQTILPIASMGAEAL